VERVTFSTRGSFPGALLALVGVHTEVCRTERLRLLSDRVRRNPTTGLSCRSFWCPRSRSFWWLFFVRRVPRLRRWEQGCELDCRAKAARRASPFFVVYPARSQRLIPSDPFVRGGLCSGEPIVFWCVGIPPMKFPKLFPASFRKVVVRFFRPVFPLRIVEPFDEI